MENIHKECFAAGSSLKCVTQKTVHIDITKLLEFVVELEIPSPPWAFALANGVFFPMICCGVVVTLTCFTPNFHLAVFGIVFGRITTSGAYVFAL
jgi:hypothetical protein